MRARDISDQEKRGWDFSLEMNRSLLFYMAEKVRAHTGADTRGLPARRLDQRSDRKCISHTLAFD